MTTRKNTPHPQKTVPLSKRIRRLEALAKILDAAVQIPGTNIRLGLDSIIGVLPVAGDAATALCSTIFLVEGKRLGVSNRTLWKMAANIGVDFLIGAFPVLGDIADVGWKANLRNVELIRRDLLPHESRVQRRKAA